MQSEPQSDSRSTDCKNEGCRRLKLKFRDLRLKYDDDKEAYLKEIAMLRGLLIEIKDIFKFSALGDIMQLP